jgi:hypothetical protein
MMAARTIMAESGLGGRFWFRTALAARDARNATYKERIGSTPCRRMYGEMRDVFRSARALEAINLGFEPNTSAYYFFIPEKNNLMTSNQARFDECSFPFRKQKMVEQFQSDKIRQVTSW